MVRWIGRFLLFRFLPARLIPLLTVFELVALVRGLRRARQARGERGRAVAGGPASRRPPVR